MCQLVFCCYIGDKLTFKVSRTIADILSGVSSFSDRYRRDARLSSKGVMMDIIGNCLVPHQFCQRLQVGGKFVGVFVVQIRKPDSVLKVCSKVYVYIQGGPNATSYLLIVGSPNEFQFLQSLFVYIACIQNICILKSLLTKNLYDQIILIGIFYVCILSL